MASRRGARTRPRKNDGLPIVNGKKAWRKGHALDDDSSWFSWKRILLILTNAVIIYSYALLGNDEAQGELHPANVVKKAPELVESVTKPAVTPPTKPAVTPPTKPPVTPPTEPPVTPPTEPPVTPPTAPPVEGRFPLQCTTEEKGLVLKQLPNSRECKIIQGDCSFAEATLRTEYAVNKQLMREFYSSDDFKLESKDHTFFSVIVNWNGDDIPIDSLLIGSRDTKYDVEGWNKKLGRDEKKALPPVVIKPDAEKRPAKVLVVEVTHTLTHPIPLTEFKENFKLTNDELVIKGVGRAKIASQMDDLIRADLPRKDGIIVPGQPIHLLDIVGTVGRDVTILNSLQPDLLSSVRYLHLEYNKRGDWAFGTLSVVIQKLKDVGLVCYWPGKKESNFSLWRITDCFLPHYDYATWSYISCVSVVHDDVAVLADRMEKKFKETIRTDQVFNVP